MSTTENIILALELESTRHQDPQEMLPEPEMSLKIVLISLSIAQGASTPPRIPPDEAPPFSDKDFLLKRDALLVPVAKKAINSDYVTVTKTIDFSNLKTTTDYLDQLAYTHAKVCRQLEQHHAHKPLYQLLDNGQGRIRSEATIFCNNLGMTIARPNTYAELMELRDFMLKNHLTQILTDATIPYSWDHGSMASQIKYPDGTSPFVTADMYWKHHDKLQYSASYSQMIVFTINNRQEIQVDAIYEKTLPAVCQTKPEQRQLRAETRFCDARTNDLAKATDSIRGALKLLTGTMPLNMAAFDNSMMSSLQTNSTSHDEPTRDKRSIVGTGAAAFAAITLLATTAGAMANNAKATDNARKIASLHVDISQIQRDFDSFAKELNRTMNSMQKEDQLIMHETRIYAAATNVKMTMQDNVVVFVHILQTIQYSQYSPLILSPAELASLQTTVFHQTAQKLSQQPTEYNIYPVLIEGELGVNIEIPLHDQTRDATIFEVVPIPSFQDGRKVLLDCDQQYIAMYENSKTYNPMDPNEVAACIATHKPCLARTPTLDNDVDNCAARQFNEDHPANSYKAAPDSTPFFYTIKNVTIYSVPVLTRVDFHCPEIDKPGADLILNISDTGYFLNPLGDCKFTTKYSQYTPPIERYSMVSKIKELFSDALDPTLYNFPKRTVKYIGPYRGKYAAHEEAQTIGSYSAILAIPCIVVGILTLAFLTIKVWTSKRRLKKAFTAFRDTFDDPDLDPPTPPDTVATLLTSARRPTSARKPPRAQPRPIFIRGAPGRTSLPNQRPHNRPLNYIDRFDLRNLRPLYPDISSSTSDADPERAPSYRNAVPDNPPAWSAPKTRFPVINPPDIEMNKLVPRPDAPTMQPLPTVPPASTIAPDGNLYGTPPTADSRSDDNGTASD